MITALLILAGSVVLGTIAHELSHAAALRAFGVSCELRWLPDRGPTGSLRMGIRGRWAMVTYRERSRDLAPWKLRVASMMPFSLAIPVFAVGLGVGWLGAIEQSLPITLGLLGWLACAIPSPDDFSIFWYPEQSIAATTRE